MSRVSPQLIVFSYHKSGTSLLLHVMTKVCDRLGLTIANHFGLVDRLDPEPDVVLLPHSLLRAPPDRPYRAIRMVRDPRDIWVSGYLYHRHCREEWCINTDLEPTPIIGWPQVDHSFAHRPEEWKRRYLERLDGRSYQRNLLDRSTEEGLAFELEGYTGCTLTAMREWILNGADAMDVKLEDVMADFDGAMLRIFDHFGFTAEQSAAALEVARSEDVRRMDDATIAARPQIHSRTISKWRDILSADQLAGFEAANGDLIRELGYEPSDPGEAIQSPPPSPAASPSVNQPEPAYVPDTRDFQAARNITEDLNFPGADKWFADNRASLATDFVDVNLVWPGLALQVGAVVGDQGTGTPMTGDPGVGLLAGGVAIRPTIRGQKTYRFIVPPGVDRVWLVSRRGTPADPRAPYLGQSRALGVRVSEIVIEFRAHEVVIPADDPRLVAGWHAAEQSGAGPWRWTDGMAELPWPDISGPAVVTVHCTSLGAYPVDQATIGRAMEVL